MVTSGAAPLIVCAFGAARPQTHSRHATPYVPEGIYDRRRYAGPDLRDVLRRIAQERVPSVRILNS
jgi:hypothetical protein